MPPRQATRGSDWRALVQVNSKLVSNTKSKISALEQELAEQKQRAGAGGGDAAAPAATAAAGAAAESETIKQLQKVLKEESEAREKAQKEAAALRQQAAAAVGVAAKPAGVPPEELKKLQLELREKEKQARRRDRATPAEIDERLVELNGGGFEDSRGHSGGGGDGEQRAAKAGCAPTWLGRLLTAPRIITAAACLAPFG